MKELGDPRYKNHLFLIYNNYFYEDEKSISAIYHSIEVIALA